MSRSHIHRLVATAMGPLREVFRAPACSIFWKLGGYFFTVVVVAKNNERG